MFSQFQLHRLIYECCVYILKSQFSGIIMVYYGIREGIAFSQNPRAKMIEYKTQGQEKISTSWYGLIYQTVRGLWW